MSNAELMPADARRRADPLAQTLLTLAKEVWTLKDRQIVLEAVLAERGIDISDAVERFQPSGAVKQRLADERRRFLAEIVDELASGPKP